VCIGVTVILSATVEAIVFVYWCACHSARYCTGRVCVCFGVPLTLSVNVEGDCVCICVPVILSATVEGDCVCISVPVTLSATVEAIVCVLVCLPL
jgi:hypothetical protein